MTIIVSFANFSAELHIPETIRVCHCGRQVQVEEMENPSSKMLGSRVNFEFAFNDSDFSDRVLHIEIMANSLDSKSDSEGCRSQKRKRETLDKESDAESSTVVAIKTYHISSPILAGNSPFFHKLFKNGMKESKQKDATLRINESEESAVMELLNFMYSNTLKATTTPDLLGVLIAADKFEVTFCMSYCSELLQNMSMAQESALLYLELPPSVLAAEVVQPLIDAAKKFLVAHYKDISKSNKEVMDLPLCAVEVVLGNIGLQVDEEDDVFDFILKWARAHYPNLEERQEILTKRLAQCICFSHMSCSKLKEVLGCPDFCHEEVTKLVLEALFSKVQVPSLEHIHASKDLATTNCTSLGGRYYNRRPIKVVQFEFPQPRCVVYFDLKKEECENLSQSTSLRSRSFCLGGRSFYLTAQCCDDAEKQSFGPSLYKENESESCTVDYEFAVIKKSSLEFQREVKDKDNFSDLSLGWVYTNLFGIPWIDFISKDSVYFINGILHLRADLTITNTEA